MKFDVVVTVNLCAPDQLTDLKQLLGQIEARLSNLARTNTMALKDSIATLAADDDTLIGEVDSLIGIINGIPAATAAAVQAALAAAGASDAQAQAAVDAIDATVKAEAAKAAAIISPPPPPATLTLSPDTVSAAVGVASSVPVSVSGGTGPYSLASGGPGGVTYDGTNVNFDTTTTAFSGDVTVQDSSSPPETGVLAVTIA
jgi:hypothetical protein